MVLKESSTSLQKQTVPLRFLSELFTKLQSLLESKDFYQEVITLIDAQFNYKFIQIWSVGSDHKPSLRAQTGTSPSHSKPMLQLKNQQDILNTVIAHQESYLFAEVSPDCNSTDDDSPSVLCVPIIKHAEVVATLYLENDIKNAFSDTDRMTLEAVASQVTVSMTNRKLYCDATEFNKKLQHAVEEKKSELRRAHERILEQQSLLQKENKILKTLVSQDSKFMDIVGKSPSILNLLSMIDKIAPTTATVLIQGESGTGKELVARRLHFKSDRALHPYVTVNCGALQESLLESELFGHEKGAFTGAVVQKMGLCETADNGTLFLDEIGEMSLGMQSKLLRFLQESEFYRIGGKKPIRVNVRILSATNRELEKEVKEGRFREDLFYRLNTITLRTPPLRKRKEDIPLLFDFFLKFSRFGGASNQIKRVDPRVIEAFSNYHWPGNIRELQNMIERMKILGENNELKFGDVPASIRLPLLGAETSDFTFNMPLEAVEKNHILGMLAYHQGNKTKAAGSLGITIKTLYNKLHRYGILQNQGEEP